METKNHAGWGIRIWAGALVAGSLAVMGVGFYTSAIEYVALGFVFLTASAICNLAAYLGPRGDSEMLDVPNPVDNLDWQTRREDANDVKKNVAA